MLIEFTYLVELGSTLGWNMGLIKCPLTSNISLPCTGLLHNATASDQIICDEPVNHADSDQNSTPDQVDHHDPSQSDDHKFDSDHHTSHSNGNNAMDDESPLPCNSSNKSPDNHHQPCSQATVIPPPITVQSPHHTTLTVLIVVLSLVLCIALLVVVWRCCRAVRDHCGRKKQARYKSVSKFFPFSYGQDSGNGVAIPEYGLPKNSAAEREILLNDSDEDEL